MSAMFGKAKQRVLHIDSFVQFSSARATVTEIAATPHSRIAVWGVRPGQEVPAHFHSSGQDTWIMLRGELTYFLGNGARATIRAGDIDVADVGEVHGAVNEGAEDAVFLSIYSAPDIGWTRAHP
jgi:quercetin dioxygenase-like cupin family protein